MEQPIIVEQSFNVPPERVWEAITQRDQMVQWFFEEIETYDSNVGADNRFTVRAEGVDYPHILRILDAVPGAKLAHTFNFEGYSGEGVVTWELSGTDTGCHLRLTHTGIETFPKDRPVFTREACQGGWEYFVQQRLKAYLDGNGG